MNLNLSWALLLIIFVGTGIRFIQSKKRTMDFFIEQFQHISTLVLSIYALLYAAGLIILNTLGINHTLPSDDASLVVILIYGAVFSLLSLKKKRKSKKKYH